MTRIRNRAQLVAGAHGQEAQARRALALDLFESALAAIDPVLCTQRALRELRSQGKVDRPVTVFAFGKAARGMAEAALSEVDVLGGIVIGFETGRLGPLDLLCGSHPLPSEDAPLHGQAMLALAQTLSKGDLALVLVSGGGSALLELPRAGLTLSDLQVTTRVLLASGANIQEVNAVRSALSRLKGGKLAQAMAPARVLNVVLSDVVGSPLPSIASGPTVAPAAPCADLTAIIARYGLLSQLSERVLSALQNPEPAPAGFDHVLSLVAADNLTAQLAIVAEAQQRGLRATRRDAYLEGEASTMAATLAHEARALDAVYVAGGETTVTLGQSPGRGGRNQELVLSAHKSVAAGGEIAGRLIAALGTDGIDGASDAAGALLDEGVHSRMVQLDCDPAVALAKHDAGSLLSATNGVILTGKTGTNVADVCIVLP